MKRLRFRIRSMLLLVAVVAAMSWGVRVWFGRQEKLRFITTSGGRTTVHELPADFDFMAHARKVEARSRRVEPTSSGPQLGRHEVFIIPPSTD